MSILETVDLKKRGVIAYKISRKNQQTGFTMPKMLQTSTFRGALRSVWRSFLTTTLLKPGHLVFSTSVSRFLVELELVKFHFWVGGKDQQHPFKHVLVI